MKERKIFKTLVCLLVLVMVSVGLAGCGDDEVISNNDSYRSEHGYDISSNSEYYYDDEVNIVDTNEVPEGVTEGNETNVVDTDEVSEDKEVDAEVSEDVEDIKEELNFVCEDLTKTMYTNSSLNIRVEPSSKYEIVGKYGYADKVSVTGKVDNGWYRVDYNGTVGYVSGKYLVEEKPVITTESTNTESSSKVSNTKSFPKEYSDSTCSITITKEWYKNAWCYAAHIVFSDYDRLGTSCGNGKYGGYETTSHAAKRLGAKLCVNGCYSAPNLNYAVARDGVVCNDKACWTPAVYNSNNGLLLSAWETGGTPGIAGVQLSTLVSEGKVTDTFCFGPPILKDGVVSSSSDGSRAQRTFIGTNGNAGDIWIVVSDGRYNDGDSAGLTYKECSEYLASKGCTFGVPLDGGGSSTMVWEGKVLNAVSSQRSVVDFLYFK